MGITNEEMARGQMLLKAIEEMGDAGLAACSAQTNRRNLDFSAWQCIRSLARASSVGAMIE